MPSDLFGTVSSRCAPSRARRPSLLVFSAIGHLLVILLIIVASSRAQEGRASARPQRCGAALENIAVMHERRSADAPRR